MSRKKSDSIYSSMLEKLRKLEFIDEFGELHVIKPTSGFGERDGYRIKKPETLSRAQKAKITRYFNDLTAATKGGYYYPFKARKPENLKIAKQFSGQNLNLPQMRYAFVPSSEGKPKIRIRNGELTITERDITKAFIPLNPARLAANPDYIKEQINRHAPRANIYSIMAGRYEIIGHSKGFGPGGKDEIIAAVKKIQAQYSDKNSHHYWGDWLLGLKAYHFGEFEQMFTHFQSRYEEIQKIKNRNVKRAKAAKQRRK